MPEAGLGVCVLILAAGCGARFRAEQDQDKLLAPLELCGAQRPVLGHVLHALNGLAEHSLIIARDNNHELRQWLTGPPPFLGCRTHFLSSAGLGETLAQGAAQCMPNRGYLVVLGDMPFVQRSTYAQLIDALAPDRLVVPLYRGQAGHPRGIGCEFRGQLLATGGDRGAAQLFQGGVLTEVEVDDPGVLCDIDRPADLDLGPARGTIGKTR